MNLGVFLANGNRMPVAGEVGASCGRAAVTWKRHAGTGSSSLQIGFQSQAP
jgi:hypothetical protein